MLFCADLHIQSGEIVERLGHHMGAKQRGGLQWVARLSYEILGPALLSSPGILTAKTGNKVISLSTLKSDVENRSKALLASGVPAHLDD